LNSRTLGIVAVGLRFSGNRSLGSRPGNSGSRPMMAGFAGENGV
jgi:hypothetical protein